jgi:hydroxymethylbilane synthase
MLPAPAQGAVVAVCREDDNFCQQACSPLNDLATALCTRIERDFLRTLMGGCTTPISAYATVSNETLHFSGELCSLDGQQLFSITEQIPLQDAGTIGKTAAEKILAQGGDKIVAQIRDAIK